MAPLTAALAFGTTLVDSNKIDSEMISLNFVVLSYELKNGMTTNENLLNYNYYFCEKNHIRDISDNRFVCFNHFVLF